jgi:hypothetical protein
VPGKTKKERVCLPQIVIILSVEQRVCPISKTRPELKSHHQEVTMKQIDITPNEKECISQCIIKYWSAARQPSGSRDKEYEQCLTRCDVCGSA